MNGPLRLLVSGDRRWADPLPVRDALDAICALVAPFSSPVLVHGAARGLDSLAADWAAAAGWALDARPAQWNVHTDACPPSHAGAPSCRMAGHRRNAEMLRPRPTLLVAFPLHAEPLAPGEPRELTSRGTWSMVAKAREASLPVLVLWRGRLWPADDAGRALVAAGAPTGSVDLASGSVAVSALLPPF